MNNQTQTQTETETQTLFIEMTEQELQDASGGRGGAGRVVQRIADWWRRRRGGSTGPWGPRPPTRGPNLPSRVPDIPGPPGDDS
jgi:hypothetical protein